MAAKTIITEPNKLLRQISKPVESVGKEEQQLMNALRTHSRAHARTRIKTTRHTKQCKQ